MHSRPETEAIRKISGGPVNPNRQFECWRCGRKGHNSSSLLCPAVNQKCNKCTRFGHFAAICRTNLKRQKSYDHHEWTMKKVRREKNFLIKCQVGSRELSLVIHSWSRYNLMSPRDWSEGNFIQRPSKFYQSFLRIRLTRIATSNLRFQSTCIHWQESR